MRGSTLSGYPLSKIKPDSICGPRGVILDKITLDAVIAGNIEIEDLPNLRIALLAQSDIAFTAGCKMLALNFQRIAELINVRQNVIMQTYEMLRPARIHS
ncbi:MAG: diol dehydratase small subunit [Paracoccaceae bacterium]|nr:diol dehydratase small subunit [Paracoccaceae bacterium]